MAVDFHLELIHWAWRFASKVDPRENPNLLHLVAGALGVIDVATLSVIRRWALRDQLSIREIARRTGLSRNTIKKYLRAGAVEPQYAKRVPSNSGERDLANWATVAMPPRSGLVYWNFALGVDGLVKTIYSPHPFEKCSRERTHKPITAQATQVKPHNAIATNQALLGLAAFAPALMLVSERLDSMQQGCDAAKRLARREGRPNPGEGCA